MRFAGLGEAGALSGIEVRSGRAFVVDQQPLLFLLLGPRRNSSVSKPKRQRRTSNPGYAATPDAAHLNRIRFSFGSRTASAAHKHGPAGRQSIAFRVPAINSGIALELDGEQRMDLTTSQREALLKLGTTASGHDFIDPDVVDELVALKLVHWRMRDDLDLTAMGNQVFKTLTAR
jgi:hypothetical protein